MKKRITRPEFILVNKTIFFPKKGILVIGDLHIGYESMLQKQGMSLPFSQIKTTKDQIQKIINQIKFKGYEVEKIILLGDIKHYFGFDKGEMKEIKEILNFLQQFVTKKNLILIKGNHDKILLKDRDYLDYYITEDKKLAFTHGQRIFPEIYDKDIKTIVMGHLHPAINLKDPGGIKKEKYKVFLIGKHKSKQFVVVPSFFPLLEGTEINEDYKDLPGFSIVPNSPLKKFKVFVVGKENVYEFGKLKETD